MELKDRINELTAFLHTDLVGEITRFDNVKDIINLQFHLPELDFPRMEICKCYIIQAHTACITMTNHLLERHCKLLLIAVDSGIHQLDDLATIEERYKPYIEKYMNSDLSATLSACKSKNLLTKEEWKVFEKYRDTFRNGFGHGNSSQILKETTGGFVSGSFKDGSITPVTEIKLKNVPALQGIAISEFAKANSWPYFVDVENFIRRTIKRYNPSAYDTDILQVSK